MKKALMITFAIILELALLLLCLSFDKEAYDNYWDNLGKGSQSATLYFTKSEMDSNEEFEILTKTAQKYNANLYRTDTENINGTNVDVKSVAVFFMSKTLEDLPIENIETQKDLELYNNYILATNNFKDKNESVSVAGKLYSFLDMQHIKIQPLKAYIDEHQNVYGTYIVEFENFNDKNSFIKELADLLGVSEEDLTTQKAFHFSHNSFFSDISIVLFMVFVGLFILFTVYYLVENFKRIGLCKLMGHSNLSVWSEIFTPILIIQLFSGSIAIILLRVFTNITRSSLEKLLVTMMVSCCFTLFVSMIFYFVLKTYTISSLIKNKKPVKLMIKANFAIRAILLTIVCTILLSVVGGYRQITGIYKTYEQWDKYGDKYAVLTIKMTDEDDTDMMNGMHSLDKKFVNLYNDLNDKGGVYVTSEQMGTNMLNNLCSNKGNEDYYLENYDSSLVNADFDPFIMTVNPNFLKSQDIYDEQGGKIDISETEADAVFLLPSNYKDNDKVMQMILKAYRHVYLQSSISYIGEEYAGDKSENVKIIYYKSGISMFSFNTEVAKDNNYILSDPVFQVMTTSNSLFLEKLNSFAQGVDSPMKIDISSTETEKSFDLIKDDIIKNDLSKNTTELISIKSVFNNEISQIKKGMLMYTIFGVILLCAACWVSIQTITIILKLKQKEFCIKICMGYKFVDKYFKPLLVFLIFDILQLTLAISIIIGMENDEQPFSFYHILAGICLLILDIGFVILSIKLLERKNMNLMMKER